MIRRRLWRQGNSTVVTLSPNHYILLGVKPGECLDMELHHLPPLGDFFLTLSKPGITIDFGHYKIVDNFVDNFVDK